MYGVAEIFGCKDSFKAKGAIGYWASLPIDHERFASAKYFLPKSNLEDTPRPTNACKIILFFGTIFIYKKLLFMCFT